MPLRCPRRIRESCRRPLLPGPEHGQQVVRVAPIEPETFPEPDEEVFERGVAHGQVLALPVEGLGESPAGVDAGERTQPDGGQGVGGVAAAVEHGVGAQGGPQALQEDLVVLAGPGRTDDRRRPLDHLRVADRPLVGLAGTHRRAQDQLQGLDAPLLCEQPVLGLDLVVEGDRREVRPVERWRGVAGRRRQPVVELVGDDDEVLPGRTPCRGRSSTRWRRARR